MVVVVAVVAVVHDSSHLFTDMLLLSSMGDLPCFGSLLFYRQSGAEQCDQSSSSLEEAQCSQFLLLFSSLRYQKSSDLWEKTLKTMFALRT